MAWLALASAAPPQTLPLAATTVSGRPLSFGQGRHEVVIINFWATWCVPCRAEMPVLDAYYRRHRGQGLVMLAVSLDAGASNGRLRELTGNFAFPVARISDVNMPRRDIPKALPVTRVYDKAGRLRFQAGGDGRTTIDAATLERLVSPLLDEK
jgi:thiol-disulfide isomerase/thioredoxin